MLRFALVVLLGVAMVASGCRVDTRPTVVRRYEPGKKLHVDDARFAGEYRLLPAVIDRRGRLVPSTQPLAQRRLVAGQAVGFARNDAGRPTAVAGDDVIALSGDGAYVWEMRATPGQIDQQKSALAAVVVIAAIGVVLGIAAASATSGISGTFVGG